MVEFNYISLGIKTDDYGNKSIFIAGNWNNANLNYDFPKSGSLVKLTDAFIEAVLMYYPQDYHFFDASSFVIDDVLFQYYSEFESESTEYVDVMLYRIIYDGVRY